jgi:hypothetical protein
MQAWLMTLSIGAMLLGAGALYFTITNIFTLLRESEVARVPATAETAVAFSAPGTYVLHIDQPGSTWRCSARNLPCAMP